MVLVRFPVGDGSHVVAEVDGPETGEEVVLAGAGSGKRISEMTVGLEDGLRSIRPALAALMGVLINAAADSVIVEFGIKLDGEAGVVIAKVNRSGIRPHPPGWRQLGSIRLCAPIWRPCTEPGAVHPACPWCTAAGALGRGDA